MLGISALYKTQKFGNQQPKGRLMSTWVTILMIFMIFTIEISILIIFLSL